ncbi:unnamed protein product [Lymnaea stagnalis]|uniref:Uncharacterized protein n=1 Tax=Lymnaea stagnalis TaxID=6523 RepID=A0AAV2HV06_LYMST
MCVLLRSWVLVVHIVYIRPDCWQREPMLSLSNMLCFVQSESTSKWFKSRNSTAPETSIQSMVKMDHSTIYKENVVLEEGLAEQIGHLKRDERRLLAETGEQLEEIRKQMQVISRLQEAVNSRNPADSTDFLSSTRASRYGNDRQEYGDHGKGNRSQMRIEAEREKFSSKNLFNVRRAKSALGFETLPQKKFFQPPVVDMEPFDVFVPDTTESIDEAPASLPEQKPPPRAKSAKGYLKPTSSSQSGMRPVTAGYVRESKPDDLLPPRAQTAVIRCRSRRELELLSRVAPKEDEIINTFENRKRNMTIISEKRRRSQLLQLRSEREILESKVSDFLMDLERFNRNHQAIKLIKRKDTQGVL